MCGASWNQRNPPNRPKATEGFLVAGPGFEPGTPGYEPSEIPFLHPTSTAGVGSETSGGFPGGLGGKPTQPKLVLD